MRLGCPSVDAGLLGSFRLQVCAFGTRVVRRILCFAGVSQRHTVAVAWECAGHTLGNFSADDRVLRVRRCMGRRHGDRTPIHGEGLWFGQTRSYPGAPMSFRGLVHPARGPMQNVRRSAIRSTMDGHRGPIVKVGGRSIRARPSPARISSVRRLRRDLHALRLRLRPVSWNPTRIRSARR